MSSLRTTKIGLAALTIVFLLLYGYFSTLGKPANITYNPAGQGFGESKIALGNLGGFHILKNIDYSDEKQFYRLLIETELNRSTASAEAITVPYMVIDEAPGQSTGSASSNTNPDELYQIRITLSDTTIEGIPTDRPLAISPDVALETDQPQLIKEVRVNETKDESSLISISLTKKALFRATADNSGTIVLDILK